MKQAAIILIVAGCLAGPALAGDWTQFRGPEGSAASEEANLPVRWSQTENLRWKVDLPGRGLSSPVIAGGRVYVTACSGVEQTRLHVLCLDLVTGKKRWERQFWATGNTLCHPKTCMAAPTPATDGQRVYALFATADLACLDADGNLVWYRSLAGDYPTIGNNVGMAASPILWKDLLLLPMENTGESFVAGIDKLTGKNRWKNDRARDINWATPQLFQHDGKTEVLFQSSKELTACDPETGARIWSYSSGGLGNVPTPLVAHGLVLAPLSQGGLLALRPEADKPSPRVVWQEKKLNSGYTTSLAYKDRVYTINGAGVLVCADLATGKVLWQQRLKGDAPYSASPVAGADKLYLVNDAGTTTVVQAGAEPKVLGANALGETILATPTLADGAIFLRSDQHLYCIAEQRK